MHSKTTGLKGREIQQRYSMDNQAYHISKQDNFVLQQLVLQREKNLDKFDREEF